MTTPTTTPPATAADFERILAEMRRLLQSAPPSAFAHFRAAVRELETDHDAAKCADDTGERT